jgi:hypothetical protein
VNGRGAFFYAWVATGGSNNVPTVIVVAATQRQRYARILSALSGVTAAYTYAGSKSTLLVETIQDPGGIWGTAMRSDGVAAITATNSAGSSVSIVPTREDLTVQDATFRAADAAKMLTTNKVEHGEVIAPAVMRSAVVKIQHSDFASASGTISRTIALPWPFADRLGFDYYSEGTPIITDAFIEFATPFQVDTSNNASYPGCTLDIGISAPMLPDTAGRMSSSALIRGARVTENANQGFTLGGGLYPVNAPFMPMGESYHGSAQSNHAGAATEWVQWSETEAYTTAPIPHIDAYESTVITSIVFEPQTAYSATAQDFTQFQIFVCPRETVPSSGNFVALDTYVDITAAPYNAPTARWTSAGVYTPPTTTAAGQPRTAHVGLLLRAGWKIAIKQIQTGAGGISDTRSWKVRVTTSAHRGKGVLLQSKSNVVVDPWSDRADTLTATINLEKKTELQVGLGSGVSEPDGLTYDLAGLDQGVCYLHIHFWQPRRIATSRTYASET